jgi:outer membrane receptor protein involved in Fe transport
VAATSFNENGWRDESKGQLQNIFVKMGRSQEDSNWDVSFLYGNSKLVGNGLTPSTNYGGEGEEAADPVDGLYELSRKAVYSHPDETQNNTSLLTFNLQRVLDANTELAATAYVRSGKQKRLGGDVEWDGDWAAYNANNATGKADSEGVLNRSNTSQTSYGVSVNMTKLLDAHQITTGASLDMSRSSYGATSQDTCEISSTRGISDCAATEDDTAGVKGGATAFGVYVADTFKVNQATHLTAAARYNQSVVDNTITRYVDSSGNTIPAQELAKEKFTYRRLNPSFGLTHQLSSNLTVFGNWAQSNRAPTVIELGCADPEYPCMLPTGLQADPFLKQVVAQTIEGGLRWKNSQDYNLAVSLYRTDNKDDILFLASDQTGMGYFSNFDKTRHEGVDISASKTWGTVRMNTSYSYLKATYEAEADLQAGDREMAITPGMRLPGLPLHTLKLNLEWQATPQLSLGAGVHYNSSLPTQGNEDGKVGDDNDAVADASIKGHTLLNLKANYQLQKGLSLFGKINNVLDTRYETYGMIGDNNFNLDGSQIDNGLNTVAKFVAPGAPRSYMVGLRYQF